MFKGANKLIKSVSQMIKDEDYLINEKEKYEKQISNLPEAISIEELQKIVKRKTKHRSFDKCLFRIIIGGDKSAQANIYYLQGDKWKGVQYKFSKIILSKELEEKLQEAPPLEYEEIVYPKKKKNRSCKDI